ncbi:WW domain-containing oxidoreductase-like [Oscarella lobularis]|uniref:WW domain-containing oxidoreductase-like n=1 Tax=Oscarella lobularis TaxID=121494 RepID=UPI0033140231
MAEEDGDLLEDLPPGWEEKTTHDKRIFYANHAKRSTQWLHPRAQKTKITTKFPYGWTEEKDPKSGLKIYVDHITGKRSYCDPRCIPRLDSDVAKRRKSGNTVTAIEVLEGDDLTGKYAIVTGSNSGLGYESAKALALCGAHVVLACRDLALARSAASLIQQTKPSAIVEVMHLDLSSLQNVKTFAESYSQKKWPLHILICNAGIMGIPYTRSKDDLEITFAVNYLGHFYLTTLLRDVLVASKPARVVAVSSHAHRFHTLSRDKRLDFSLLPYPESHYWPMLAYAQSKLCLVMFTNELNRRLAGTGVTANAANPGNMIPTNLNRNSYLYKILFFLARSFTKSVEQGAATIVYCAASDDVKEVGGKYFSDCCECDTLPEANDSELAKRLWEFSEDLIAKHA